jgi:hypothetical protein
MNLTRGIDLKKIADKMSACSGAELKACCTEAGMFALRERRVHVTQEDFEMAVAKVGLEQGRDVGMPTRGHVHTRYMPSLVSCAAAAGHEEGLGQEHVREEAVEVEAARTAL